MSVPRYFVSRQQSWQTFKNSKGLCRKDGKHPIFRSGECVEHYVREELCRKKGFTRDPKQVRIVCKALVLATQYGRRVGLREAELAARRKG